jgi:nucleoside-diphosphate-sugar epimerase
MRNQNDIDKILVTGGAGYVGAVLVPQLLDAEYSVSVLDLFLYGEEPLASVRANPALELITGDIRDSDVVERAVEGCDAVIHLACISNDPSFELDPDLSKSINFDAFEPLVRISKEAGVSRFIYASSSSVYGVSDAPDVDEEQPLVPLTDYSKFKALCEPIMLKYQSPEFTTVIVRPATVCGYSPRQRLDLVVNILTAHAVVNGKIRVFGGDQLRPNLHVADVVDLYQLLLEVPAEKIAGEVFNVGFENLSVNGLAELVKSVVQEELPSREVIEIERERTDDERSYHINSEKVTRVLGFEPSLTIADAIREITHAISEGRISDPMNNPKYYNVKTMLDQEME